MMMVTFKSASYKNIGVQNKKITIINTQKKRKPKLPLYYFITALLHYLNIFKYIHHIYEKHDYDDLKYIHNKLQSKLGQAKNNNTCT